MCFPHPRNLSTPPLIATEHNVIPKSTLAPEATELGGMWDTIWTPINAGYGDFLDYLAVTVHAALQRVKISFHGFTAPFRVIF